MSLILGIFTKTGKRDSSTFKKMFESFTLKEERPSEIIEHGPLKIVQIYGNSLFTKSIMADTICVVSGRIYNMPPYFSSNNFMNNPCQPILEAYFKQGTSLFRQTDGEFSCIFYNQLRNELIIANDTWGLYPLYYLDTPDYFIFCNEYEPLTVFPNVLKHLDYFALNSYFQYGTVLNESTFFEQIKSLPPASVLKISGNGFNITSYYEHKINTLTHINAEEAATHIAYLFKQAVQKRVEFFRNKIDTLLSGGADTRLILSCLNKSQRENLDFYTFLTPPLSSHEDEDGIIAGDIAQINKLNHHYKNFDFWEKPFGEDYFKEKRKRIGKYYLSGHFGSEILKLELFKALDEMFLKLSRNELTKTVQPIFNNKITNILETRDWTYDLPNNNSHNDENRLMVFLTDRLCRSFFTRTWQGSRSIYFEQPTYMQHIFITPFLDKDLLSFIFSLPISLLGIGANKVYNLLFKNHFPEFTNIETNSPLADDIDSVFKKSRKGYVTYINRSYNYEPALKSLLSDVCIRERYSSVFLNKITKPELASLRQSFIDFEIWQKSLSC
ncbi:MAG: hypothetical protein PHT69_03415 [Bacteroidales bacterium]|nr:hypothetical protein [Bacteroidales bacterium]